MTQREIKFRAWDKKKKEWHKYFWISEAGEFGRDGGCDPPCTVYKEDYIVSQYTGLKDRNGKDIYEGDIVIYKHIDMLDEDDSEIFLIEYMELQNCGHCINDNGIGFNLYLHESSELEIIGNEFENPELREKL